MEQTAVISDGGAAFAAHGHAAAPALIAPALTAYLWTYAQTKFAAQLMDFGDRLFPTALFSYGDAAFDGLMEHVRPRVEAIVGRALYPTFSYFRIHKKGDVLKRHRDRPASEIVATVNIGQIPHEPWPFSVEGTNGPVTVALAPGDAMIYRGHVHPHWREPFAGRQLVQASLSYVEQAGPHAGLKFDSRPSLMRRGRKSLDPSGD